MVTIGGHDGGGRMQVYNDVARVHCNGDLVATDVGVMAFVGGRCFDVVMFLQLRRIRRGKD